MSIRCAHCKGYHGSIDEVRNCSKIEQAMVVFTEPLIDQDNTSWKPDRGRLPLTYARDSVPEGHYAITIQGGLKFYRVRRPGGKWAGRIFTDRQHGDEYYPIFSRNDRNRILDEIAKDTQGASAAYGHSIGRCGICSRTLTNEVSRTAGIGPVCRERMGW